MSWKTILAALFLTQAAASAHAAPDQPVPPRQISLIGTGTVKATPDLAHITTGVSTEAPTAREALAKNNGAMTRVVEELKKEGLDPKDIQTIDFAVHPIYQRGKDGNQTNVIGYRAVNSVRVDVRDIKRLGEILDRVVTLGSNQIGGIQFTVSEPDRLQDAARKDAMTNAKAKAQLYADAAGAALGRVLTISEETIQPLAGPVFARAAVEAKAADVPLEPGTETMQVRLHVTWELQ